MLKIFDRFTVYQPNGSPISFVSATHIFCKKELKAEKRTFMMAFNQFEKETIGSMKGITCPLS